MRIYAAILTAILTGWFTVEVLLTWSKYDVLGIIFLACIASYLGGAAFWLATHKRRRRARWEKQENGLEVMIQGRRKAWSFLKN